MWCHLLFAMLRVKRYHVSCNSTGNNTFSPFIKSNLALLLHVYEYCRTHFISNDLFSAY